MKFLLLCLITCQPAGSKKESSVASNNPQNTSSFSLLAGPVPDFDLNNMPETTTIPDNVEDYQEPPVNSSCELSDEAEKIIKIYLSKHDIKCSTKLSNLEVEVNLAKEDTFFFNQGLINLQQLNNFLLTNYPTQLTNNLLSIAHNLSYYINNIYNAWVMNVLLENSLDLNNYDQVHYWLLEKFPQVYPSILERKMYPTKDEFLKLTSLGAFNYVDAITIAPLTSNNLINMKIEEIIPIQSGNYSDVPGSIVSRKKLKLKILQPHCPALISIKNQYSKVPNSAYNQTVPTSYGSYTPKNNFPENIVAYGSRAYVYIPEGYFGMTNCSNSIQEQIIALNHPFSYEGSVVPKYKKIDAVNYEGPYTIKEPPALKILNDTSF